MEFKSRRKQQFRKKAGGGEAEDDATTTTPSETPPPTSSTPSIPTTPVPATPTSSLPSTPSTTPSATPTSTNGSKVEKNERSEKPKPTLLSFGEDEEEEEFQVKRTHRSKQMTKEVKESKERPFHRELPQVVSTATPALSGGAGEYTPERMEELRRNAMAYTRPKQEETKTPTTSEKEAEIPTPAQIHAARERRKGVREGKDGFIPLEGGGGGGGGGGRLVREEGEDDDVDEEGRDSGARIDMAGNIKRTKDIKEVINIDEEEEDPEDDEELKRWEMDRIRKGVGAQEMKRKDLLDKARTNKSPARAGLDLGRKSTVTIETITKDIRSTLVGLQDAHRAHTTQLERIKDELRVAQHSAESMQEQVKDGADEYSFFAGMKIYVADLLDCLGAKAELVEQAEDKQLAAYRVRTAKNRAHAQRRLDAMAQEMKEISEEAAGYGKGGVVKARPKEETKKKRARGEEEGWSSDEESKEVNDEFEIAEREAREMGVAVFADVDEQYCKIAKIKERFERWKKEYSNSYKQAFISLSLPQLFSPFVRLQLLAREPLRDGLDTMDWYKDLFEYGMSTDGEAVEDDEDNFLVPKLVEKVVVPRIHDALTHVWNPQSRTSNARALAAVQEALVYTDAFAAHMKELFAGVLGSLQNCVKEIQIPMYRFPKEGDIGSKLPWEFSCKMMWRGIKLLRNITAWHEVIAAGPLQQLTIDNLITSKILPFLRTLRDSNTALFLDAYESVVDCLPPSWTMRSQEENGKKVKAEEGTVPANLAIFHDPLLTAANKLAEEDRRERNNKNSSREREKERQRLIGKAVSVLAKLGDKDNANLIARATSIKV